MDWVLSITTFLVNSGLGWTKGKPWMWCVHALNAAVWIAYSLAIKQYGLILLSAITIVVDLLSAWRANKTCGGRKPYRRRKAALSDHQKG